MYIVTRRTLKTADSDPASPGCNKLGRMKMNKGNIHIIWKSWRESSHYLMQGELPLVEAYTSSKNKDSFFSACLSNSNCSLLDVNTKQPQPRTFLLHQWSPVENNPPQFPSGTQWKLTSLVSSELPMVCHSLFARPKLQFFCYSQINSFAAWKTIIILIFKVDSRLLLN